MHWKETVTAASANNPTEDTNSDGAVLATLRSIYPPDSNWADFFLHHKHGNGKKFLVSKQFSDIVDPNTITDDDAELHMLIAAHVHSLSKNEKSAFAEILKRVRLKCLSEAGSSKDTISPLAVTMTHCSIPTTSLLMSHYEKGQRAIMTNIPVPKIRVADNNDAYVDLSDVLKLYFSFGLRPDAVRRTAEAGPIGGNGTVNSVWHSRAAKMRLHKLAHKSSTTIKFAMVKWSDGCDPNRSTKGSRGSMHVGTVSLFAPGNANDPRYTFVVHIGRDDSDHMEVGRAVLKEIETLELPNLVYDGDSFKEVQIIHLAMIEDRPQKSKTTGFGSHAGNLTTRHPFCVPIAEDLSSCDVCFDRRCRLKSSHKSNTDCTDCHDWCFETVRWMPPEGYPEEEVETDGYLPTKRVTFADMTAAAKKVDSKLRSKDWSRVAARDFLKCSGINAAVSKSIVDNATASSPVEVEDVLPPVWKVPDGMDRHGEATMHMIFLGVSKTVAMTVRDFLTLLHKWKPFYLSASRYMAKMRQYSLHFCRAWIYGSMEKPFGIWVSENHLAHVRCFKMVFFQLEDIARNDNEHENELRIAQHMVCAWVAVVARVMQKPVNGKIVNSLERHIKIFLSLIVKLDEFIMEKKLDSTRAKDQKKTRIETVSNLSGLLNLPEQVREFGPPRNYWEGGYRGEGILLELKQLVSMGTYHSWFAKSAMERYYKTKTIEMIMESNSSSSSNEDDNDDETSMEKNSDNKDQKYSMYYRYNNVDNVSNLINTGMPLSAFMMKDGKICVSVGRNNKQELYEINIDDSTGKVTLSTYFTHIGLGEKVCTCSRTDTLPIEKHVLFLPNTVTSSSETDETGNVTHYYLVVDEHWKERVAIDNKISFVLPKVPSVTY